MTQRYWWLVILVGVLFSACGSKGANVHQGVSPPSMSVVSYSDPYMPTASLSSRRVSTDASIEVEVEKIEEAHQKLLEVVEEMKGYIANDNLREEDGHYYAKVLVPSSRLESTLTRIGALGEKQSQSIHNEDVTDSILDNQEQLKNLKLFRNKMKVLLDRTTNIEDILKIERELNRVQTQIDRIEQHLKQLKGRVEMSPIQVELEERTIYGPLGYIAHGLWWVVKKLFVIR